MITELSINSWEDLISSASKFIKSLRDGSKVLILYNGDPDGCASAVQLEIILENEKKKIKIKKHWVASYSYLFERELELILRLKPEYLIFLDLPIIQEIQTLGQMSEITKAILIYDHHNVSSRLKLPTNVLYLNSRVINGKVVRNDPTAYFTYCLGLRYGLNKNITKWLIGIGLIGDFALENYPEILSSISKYSPDLNKGKDIYDVRFRRISGIINASYKYNPLKATHLAFDLLKEAYECEDPFLVFDEKNANALKLQNISRELKVEIDNEIKRFNKNKTEHGSSLLLTYASQSKHFIAGIVAGISSGRYKDKIISVGFRYGHLMQNEIRVGEDSKIDLIKLLKNLSINYDCLSSGGHSKAAGALIEFREYRKFVEALNETVLRLEHEE